MLLPTAELLFWPEVDDDGDEVEDGPDFNEEICKTRLNTKNELLWEILQK